MGNTIFNVKVFPLRDEQGEIIGLIGTSIDITERVAHEEKLKQQHLEIIKTNKKIAEYKLMALRSVMNPHFLFNSLSSIQFFIAKNEREQALNYLSLFSKLIRGILNSSVNSTIPLAQELEILKYYVELESLRFENKFETDFVVSDGIDADNLEIPSLLIQPYVENAIIHGLYNKEGRGKLTVSLSQHKNLLQCVVEDNGVGRKEALHIKKQNSIRHKSVGMMVTKERLDIINTTNKVSVKIHDLRDERGLACGTSVNILIQI
jgi:sensor histidine kinase YesM